MHMHIYVCIIINKLGMLLDESGPWHISKAASLLPHVLEIYDPYLHYIQIDNDITKLIN